LAPIQRLITLTTDFGTSEHYVGAMKGVIYNINPAAVVVDICNSVHSYDLLDGALTIAQAYSYFPANSLHVVVVDPGVGATRRPILVTAGNHMFLAPDNGVLSLVYDREERVTVRHVTADHYFLQPVSNTFHGRDVFAAVAGWVSKGVEAIKFGEEITDYARFAAPKPKTLNPNLVKGIVIRIDKFGNLITNITPKDVPQLFAEPTPPFKILLGRSEITKFKGSYAQGAPGEVFAILGSMGYLEIATNRGSAQQSVGAEKGSEVGIVLEGTAPTPAA
jgi:S-adenosyl-L-methionine hydrolase (adenosine-forming)